MPASQMEAFNYLFSVFKIRIPNFAFSTIGALIGAVSLILSGLNVSYDFTTRPNPMITKSESYDIIIVGAGTAGCVIANRLAKGNKRLKILLLEAGGDPLMTHQIPYLAAYNIYRSDTDWMYKAIPQANSSFSYKENAMPYAQGKSVGGSSTQGFMVHTRGNPNDFDNWAALTQDDQWSYKNVLPFFKKSEDYSGNFPSSQYHGTDGLLKIHRSPYQPAIGQWIGAGHELGYQTVDPNGRQVTSFVPIDYTMQDGRRFGMYEAFLKPALKRRNLKVVRYATATKINLDSSFRAKGLSYQRFGNSITVHAKKEIILCAGAIGSPHLLMLSGIGPIQFLTAAGVNPTVNLPGVGSNLQDHVSTLIGPFIMNKKISLRADRNITLGAAMEFATKGTGPFSFSYVSGMAFINTSNHNNDWPNIALLQSPIGVHKHLADDLHHFFGIKKDDVKTYLHDSEKKDAVFVLMSLGKPKSRGFVMLKNKDHATKPYINPNFYGELTDLIAMVEGFRLVVKLFEETETWGKYGAKLPIRSFPGCEAFKLRSDVYYECYLRHFTATMWNPSSTCKMGRVDDPMAVVDSNLRVKYITGLRVADASVMPVITNAFLNANVIMIAEKAADMILKTWQNN